MAITAPILRGNGFLDQFGSAARTDTSSSFTPAANALLVCVAMIYTQKSTAVGSSMSSTGLGAGAFTKRCSIGPGAMLSGGSGYYATAEIWVGRAGAAPGAGTFSHVWTSPTSNTIRSWAFLEIPSGFDPNVLTAAGATGSIQGTTSPVVTMSATPANTSLVLSTCSTWDSGAAAPITVPSAFTQLIDQVWTGWDSRSKLASRNDGTNTATHQWTTSGGSVVAAALEIPEAAGGGGVTLAIDNAAHAHTAENVVLQPVLTLGIDNTAHAHTAPDIPLSQLHVLAVDNADHLHTASTLVVTTQYNLAIADSTHGHVAESLTLTQVHVLAVDSAAHAHAADTPTLAVVYLLAVGSAAHTHLADNVAISSTGNLGVDSAAHTHIAESLTLVQSHVLAIDSAQHGHVATTLDLVQTVLLVVASAVHAHAAEDVGISTVGILNVQSAAHAHTADTLAMALGVVVLNDALAVYLGITEVQRVYVGSTQVWP
jgi:hypothetical protein